MSIIRHNKSILDYRCVSSIEKSVQFRHGPAAVTWSLFQLCHWIDSGKVKQMRKRSQKNCL